MRWLTVAVIAVAGFIGWSAYTLRAPLPLSTESEIVIVAPGTSLIRLAGELNARGVLPHPRIWQWYVRLTGKDGSIQAGEYRLTPDMNSLDLLQQLLTGDVVLHALTILEGWTTVDLLKAIRSQEALVSTLPAPVSDWELVTSLGSRLGLPYPHAEGLFYPDTYRFPRGTTDVELLKQAAARQTAELAAAWEGRAPDPLIATPYDMLILASIIERETAVDAERATIAGVFLRRLQRRMRLQTDPTVIYGLGAAFDGNLTRRDLKTDTPYNTYTRGGLPPTPIALPTAASLQAVAMPEPGDALYFVAAGDGSGRHVFSATLEDHNKAVAAYLKRLKSKP